MTYSAEGDEVRLTMTRDEYAALMGVLLGVALSRLAEQPARWRASLEFIQQLLQLNAHPPKGLFPPMDALV
jgi:hypothetical protein